MMFFLIFFKVFSSRPLRLCGELLHKFLSIVSVMEMLYNLKVIYKNNLQDINHA